MNNVDSYSGLEPNIYLIPVSKYERQKFLRGWI